MDLNAFRSLLTPAGQEALQAASELSPRALDFLRHFQALSRRYPPDLARAALEIAILRLEAAAKFPFADRMYLTREAMEQASSWEVASYRTQRYAPFDRIIDLGCSIGSDTIALAKIAPTVGIDLDPLRLAMVQTNQKVLNLPNRASFIRADLTIPLPLSPAPQHPALFFDPARRTAHKRAFSVREYTPPLSIVKNWLADFPALGVKISPGVKLNELANYDAEIEFISLRGSLKEAVLWFGPLKRNSRRAAVLPGPHVLETDLPPGELVTLKLPLNEPLAHLYEPDPAVLRAGLVYQLGEQLDAYQLDPDIAYLTTSELKSTPFTRSWRVEDWFPFGLKRLRAYLRQRSVGRVTVKKRGSPLQPEALIHDLRLKGDQEQVVFLTHLSGEPIVIVCFSEYESI